MKVNLKPTEIHFSARASQALKRLKPIFKKLRSIHQDYCDAVDDDCTLWYGERPQTGWLAAAVWKCGGVAKEEYIAPKKHRKQKNGRCDLWLRIIKPRETIFCCEAKYIRLNLGGNPEILARTLAKGLAAARRDLHSLKDLKLPEDGNGVALCFVTPQIRSTKLASTKATLKRLIKLASKDPLCQGLVWLEGQRPYEHKKWAWPGLLIAIGEK